jgi:ribonucleoside-diphosphate reductase alpha chain
MTSWWPWKTTGNGRRGAVTGEPVQTLKARDLMQQISEAAHVCGDPGLQYDSTINRWHTCKNSGPINASNPCSEYMFLDDSACNLASINLMKFVDEKGEFQVERFKHAVRILLLRRKSWWIVPAIQPSGLPEFASVSSAGPWVCQSGGVADASGLAYDSDAGRAYAGAVTALMTGQAYGVSQDLAGVQGSFEGWEENRKSMADVMRMHRDAVDAIDPLLAPGTIRLAARDCWDRVVSNAAKGFRNAQVTVLAPTGTIGFMMDCDTTGVEPDIALVKYKQLAGGGMMKIVNRTLGPALSKLGYTTDETEAIVKYVDATIRSRARRT